MTDTSLQPARTTTTTTTTSADPALDEGDHDRMAHIVFPKHKITEAMINGTPCTALCGKTWVPTRDPKRYPVCPTCLEVFKALGKDEDALT